MSNWAIEAFGEQLVTKDGVKSTAEVLANKSRVALYFSAHWVCRYETDQINTYQIIVFTQCPPCRGFTPVLAEFYEQLKDEDENALEIIFVSSDNDVGSFTEYYGTMPWTSVPFTNTKHIQNLGQQHSIRGIPALIVLDAATGAVKDADGRTTISAAKGVTSKATKKWA